MSQTSSFSQMEPPSGGAKLPTPPPSLPPETTATPTSDLPSIPFQPATPEKPSGNPIIADAVCQRWLKEIHRFLPVKSHFMLHGNIRDRFAIPLGEGNYDMKPITEFLTDFLVYEGYKNFLLIDPVHGISVIFPDSATLLDKENTINWLNRLGNECDITFDRNGLKKGLRVSANASFARALEFSELLVHQKERRVALFFDYLMGQCEGGQTKEIIPFIRALIMSYEARAHVIDSQNPTFNTLFWCCDRENDLPAWFSLNNPRIRSIMIPKPDREVRRLVCQALLACMGDFETLSVEEHANCLDEYTRQTEGMLMNDVDLIALFSRSQGLGAREIGTAARGYKLGITEDPWKKISNESIEKIEGTLARRVKGQQPAITKTMDILRRAVVGLASAQASKSSGKPKGVLFFAGPTGTGKTEMAKSLTEGLFGDERAYIRFDMSEYNHEQSDQRLVGAPPGYVGYDSGGQLTDAIKEKPFSVVLFDEIEKAHPKILDKFLQILDDGQLTSGKGERVYFSETIIIFTSNLGMDRATQNDDYPTLEDKLRTGIDVYFKEKLNRPELLNRIGDNIVVFDFVRPQVAVEILDKMVINIMDRIADSLKIHLNLSPEGRQYLIRQCTSDLSNGGRGIGNKLESFLINPLARELYRLQGWLQSYQVQSMKPPVLEIIEVGVEGSVPYVKLAAVK